jgi:phosphonate transport system ATP-binding protein
MGDAIQVAGLTKELRDGQRLLDGVSLAIEPGEMVALVGPNGAGKSTLLRCLVRLVEPTRGRVQIGDMVVTSLGPSELRFLRQRVGFVFQQFHVVPRLTVFHNVLLGAIGRDGPRAWWPMLAASEERREVMTCLDRVGLADLANRRVDTLSGGERQRVAIARALFQRPSVVLADEPVASLDPAGGAAVMTLLHEVVRERGLTALVALHQIEYARRYADRVIGLQRGKLALNLGVGGWEQEAIERLYRPSHAAGVSL